MTDPLVQIGIIAVVGTGAQWLASRLRLPSILLLLLGGFLVGPTFGLIQPDELLGESLFPFVSAAVAVILFEGGMTLRLQELKSSGPAVLRLISLGALVTWAIGTLAAHFILQLDWSIALLLSAVLVVTGPTVVGPLLRLIRPKGRVASILKWEGILIDPVGAILAVLVFEAILLGGRELSPWAIFFGLLWSLFIGAVVGLAVGALIILILRRRWAPDHLISPLVLMFVLGTFVLSNAIAEDSGLMAVTIMGVALANQKWQPVRQIVVFKENLQVLLIGTLFILLAGRLEPDSVVSLGWPALLFVGVLIVIARPLAVLLSTLGLGFERREVLFLSWLAPRGIVAASVSSVFAFELAEAGYEQAAVIAPATFVVIVVTVLFYGLTAGPLARRIGLAEAEPQGALLIGASQFSRQLAHTLVKLGYRAQLIDSNFGLVSQARLDGLEAYHGNAITEETVEALDLSGIGRVLAMTPNNDVNSLVALHFGELMGSAEAYQLMPPESNHENAPPASLRGRYLFADGSTYAALLEKVVVGWEVKATHLTPQFGPSEMQAYYNGLAIPLAAVLPDRRLQFATLDLPLVPRAGQTLIILAPPEPEKPHDAH